MSTIQPLVKTTEKHCENCGHLITGNRYEISRYRIMCSNKAFRCGKKYIMRVCDPCINDVVTLFTDKKHNVTVTLLDY